MQFFLWSRQKSYIKYIVAVYNNDNQTHTRKKDANQLFIYF